MRTPFPKSWHHLHLTVMWRPCFINHNLAILAGRVTTWAKFWKSGLKKMEDFFDLAHCLEANKSMMGRFKPKKSAKLWWQDHCRENALHPMNATWEYTKMQLCKNYQARTIELRGSTSFCIVYKRRTLLMFFINFLKILNYAPPGTTQEAKVAIFYPNSTLLLTQGSNPFFFYFF